MENVSSEPDRTLTCWLWQVRMDQKELFAGGSTLVTIICEFRWVLSKWPTIYFFTPEEDATKSRGHEAQTHETQRVKSATG